MNRLKIKRWVYAFSLIMGIVLFQGCNRSSNYWGGDSAAYSFIELEQVVEVDADTKSFRIIVEWVDGEDQHRDIPVYLDTINTTARHKVHFINHVDVDELYRQYEYTIGDFTPMDSDNMFYRDVELIPENITSEVSIFYYIQYRSSTHLVLNDRLKVILIPKTNKD